MPSTPTRVALCLCIVSLFVSGSAGLAADGDGAAGPSIIDLDVIGQTTLPRGGRALFEARVFRATDWLTRVEVQAEVTARLEQGESVRELETVPAAGGVWVEVPRDLPVGDGKLVFETKVDGEAGRAVLYVEVVETTMLFVWLDAGIVAPGGRLGWRAQLVDGRDRRPLSEDELRVRLTNRRGSPLVDERIKTNRFGSASGTIAIPAHVQVGAYHLRIETIRTPVVAQDAEVIVKVFEPQAFFLDIEQTSRPELRMTDYVVTARHADGSPMAGAQVETFADGLASILSGVTDQSGRFRMSSEALRVQVKATDARGEVVEVWQERAPIVSPTVELVGPGEAPIAGEHFVVTVLSRVGSTPASQVVRLGLEAGGRSLGERMITTSESGVGSAAFMVPPLARARAVRYSAVNIRTLDVEQAGPGGNLLKLRGELEALDASSCFERGSVSMVLESVKAEPDKSVPAAKSGLSWQQAFVYRPFAERPDFEVKASLRQSVCLGQVLGGLSLDGLNGRVEVDVSIFERMELGYEDVTSIEVKAFVDGGADEAKPTARLQLTTTPQEALGLSAWPRIVEPGGKVAVRLQGQLETWVAPMAILSKDSVVLAFEPMVGGRASLVAPPGLSGLVSVEVRDDERLGAMGATRNPPQVVNVFVRPAMLEVGLVLPERVRPGEAVDLEVSVSDGGKPVDAGLSATVVDERVLSLSPEVADAPSLAGALSAEMAEAVGISQRTHQDLVRGLLAQATPGDAELALLDGLIGAVPRLGPASRTYFPAAARTQGERRWAGSHLGAIQSWLVKRPDLRVDAVTGVIAPPLHTAIAAVVPQSLQKDPWGRERRWKDVGAIHPEFGAEAIGREITERRAQLILPLLERVKVKGEKPLREVVTLKRYLEVDAYGSPFIVREFGEDLDLVSAGPDWELGTEDDQRWSTGHLQLLSQSLGGMGYSGMGAGGGGGEFKAFRTSVAGGPEVEVRSARENFETTALWSTGSVTVGGRHKFELPLSDAITTWRVDVEALTGDGRVGHARRSVVASLPVSVDVRLPGALVVGDRYEAQALVVNTSRTARDLDVVVAARGIVAADTVVSLGQVGPGTSRMVPIGLMANQSGKVEVELSLQDRGDGKVIDSIIKKLDVQGIGAEMRSARRARISGSGELDARIPVGAQGVVVTVKAHRGVMDVARSSLEGLLKMPTGCFEQTTATNWPNLLVMRLLTEDGVAGGDNNAVAISKAREVVTAGYERIKTFEGRGGGFGLYPGETPSTVLTALGLVQLADTARVMSVDPALVRRTARWMVGRQGGDGSFRADVSWHRSVDERAVTAYVAWALLELLLAVDSNEVARHQPEVDGKPGVVARLLDADTEKAVKVALGKARRTLGKARPGADPMYGRYVRLLARLAGAEVPGKVVEGPSATLFSGGAAAEVELMALELKVALRAGMDVSRWVDGLMAVRLPTGSWSTTQATVFALRALGELGGEAPKGKMELRLAGHEIEALDLGGAALPVRTLTAVGEGGALAVTVPAPMFVELEMVWREADAPTRQSSGLVVHVDAPRRAVKVGEAVVLQVAVSNPGEKGVAMPTVTLEVPAGFAVNEAALQRQRGSGGLQQVEVFGNRVNLYFDKVDAKQALMVPLEVVANTAVDVAMRPAEAFAYYDPEVRGRSDQLRLVAIR